MASDRPSLRLCIWSNYTRLYVLLQVCCRTACSWIAAPKQHGLEVSGLDQPQGLFIVVTYRCHIQACLRSLPLFSKSFFNKQKAHRREPLIQSKGFSRKQQCYEYLFADAFCLACSAQV